MAYQQNKIVKNYEINLLSEKHVEFSAGHVYLVQSKINFDKKEFVFSKDAFYMNYSFREAVKIVPFFESLSVKEQNRIKKFLNDSYGFKVRVDDLLGKLLVTIFYNIELHNLFIVGLVGLADNSIGTLIELLKKAVSKEKFKVVILTNTSFNLHESLSVIKL
jgi:hypothetical protein